MLDWIRDRIEIIRNDKIVDFLDYKSGISYVNDLQVDNEAVKFVNYAKGQKNIDRSPLKQTAQRLKKEQINE